MLGPLYWLISKILLLWHSLFSAIGLVGEFLYTNWDWVLAIVFMVITIRAILFPVFVKQIKSQRAMQALAPQLSALKEKHKGDRESLQRATMELYKQENANPLMGCLPMVIQIPVMWSLFHVLRHLKATTTSEHTMQLYGWTVGQFKSAVQAKFFGAPITASFRSHASDLAAQHASVMNVRIVAAILVVIMIITTYMTSRQMILKTGWSEDPTQKMVQRLMLYGIPVTLLISGFNFPIGVVLYWTTTNLFSLGQQLWVLRKYPPPATAGRAPSTVPPIGGTPRTPATAKAVTSGKAAGSGKAAPARASADKAAAKPATTRFGRKPAVPPPAPVRETNKALAPKPGAKPANPKRGTSSAKQVKPAQTAESAEKSGTPAPKGTTSGQNGSKAKSPAKRTTG